MASVVVCQRTGCARTFPYSGVGRPRVYCSDKCKQSARPAPVRAAPARPVKVVKAVVTPRRTAPAKPARTKPAPATPRVAPAPVIAAFAPPPAELGQAGRQIERELTAPRLGPVPVSEPKPQGPVELRVLAELTKVKRQNTLYGTIALSMARQLDESKGLSGLATTASALLVMMEQATAGVGPKDEMDELRARRDSKLG